MPTKETKKGYHLKDGDIVDEQGRRITIQKPRLVAILNELADLNEAFDAQVNELNRMHLRAQQPMVGIGGSGVVRFNGGAECHGAATWLHDGKLYVQINGLIITVAKQ